MKRLVLVPLEFEEANTFITRHHRHHGEVQGHKFSLGAVADERVVGICVVGRPTPRGRQDGLTLEVTRLCSDGSLPPAVDRHGREHADAVCSFLYGAAARAAFGLGYRRIGTYILASENGASLKASGWRLLGEVKGRSWNAPSRPRVDKHPTQDKLLYGRP